MRALERQQQRKRVYSLTTFFGVIGIGGLLLAMVHSTGRRNVAALYRDPVRALSTTLALKEVTFKNETGRFASLEELVKKGDLSEELLQGPVQGYLYRSPVANAEHFLITVDPQGPPPPPPPGVPAREIQRYHYTMDETFTVRGDLVAVTTASLVFSSPRDPEPR
ncbi:MAG TPA: hypothetical protein VFF73_17220 [Planctomycetota bacterium]|nr:hypothetical protein [Planctomycetota bacterium]